MNEMNQSELSVSDALQLARDTAQYINDNYPGWKDSLPDCPCTEAEIKTDSQFSQSRFMVETFHPGAETGYRSEAQGPFESTVKDDIPPLNPRQQCTYKDGLYITDGPGAGTPDTFADFLRHQTWDVAPANAMDWQEYNATWTPNNGKECPSFFVGPEESVEPSFELDINPPDLTPPLDYPSALNSPTPDLSVSELPSSDFPVIETPARELPTFDVPSLEPSASELPSFDVPSLDLSHDSLPSLDAPISSPSLDFSSGSLSSEFDMDF